MGLASSTRDRLVPQDKQQFHSHSRRWYEKPFTLANACCVASPIAILRSNSALTASHKIGLESLFRISNATHWRTFRNTGYKPMTLIVAKQEAVLFSSTPAQQQQVTISRLNIQDHQFRCRSLCSRNQEVFSAPVLTYVEREILGDHSTRQPVPPIKLSKFNSRSHPCESAFQRIHIQSNLRAMARASVADKTVRPLDLLVREHAVTGRACAHEESNLPARRLFLPREVTVANHH
jgi:hypothetical protein